VGDVTMGECFRYFGQVFLTVGGNLTSHFGSNYSEN